MARQLSLPLLLAFETRRSSDQAPGSWAPRSRWNALYVIVPEKPRVRGADLSRDEEGPDHSVQEGGLMQKVTEFVLDDEAILHLLRSLESEGAHIPRKTYDGSEVPGLHARTVDLVLDEEIKPHLGPRSLKELAEAAGVGGMLETEDVPSLQYSYENVVFGRVNPGGSFRGTPYEKGQLLLARLYVCRENQVPAVLDEFLELFEQKVSFAEGFEDALGRLTPGQVRKMLRSANPAVRKQALAIIGDHGEAE